VVDTNEPDCVISGSGHLKPAPRMNAIHRSLALTIIAICACGPTAAQAEPPGTPSPNHSDTATSSAWAVHLATRPSSTCGI
jgi:hypothetical protein